MIALIGSGNVATWIAQRLAHSSDFPVGQVYSRRMEHARAVAALCSAEPIDDLRQLDPACEIFVFALRDEAYPQIMEQISFRMPVAVHTAGTVSQEVFAPFAERYGVLYPLQTLTKCADMRQITVPLCVQTDALGPRRERLLALAAELSEHCTELTEEQRGRVHLAAVFACNFSNAMCTVADELMRAGGLDFKMLLPVVRQTVEKLEQLSPSEAQTGPAIRRDMAVMQRHLQCLDEEKQSIYRQISEYIMQHN